MLRVGIVGLPNAGKSTLFNALISHPKAHVGEHPFTTIEKNIGVVDVPDEILFQLAKIENINTVTPTRITFVDIAGLIKGAHEGEGLGNQFLHHIREVDLILHLVRFFHDKNIPHVHAEIDPEEDVEVVNEELALADLQSLEKRLTKEKVSNEEKELIKKLINYLNLEPSNQPYSTASVDFRLAEGEENALKSLNLLSFKPQLIVANIGEEELNNPPKELNGQGILSISAKLEAELSELPWTEQQRFLKEYGLAKTVKDHIIRETYNALDIVTFYTIAKRTEARAWSLKKGRTALDAAAKIHTDFASHFVKVEVIGSDELLHIGSWHNAHELGKIALHGKEYVVQDRDVLEFKVSIK